MRFIKSLSVFFLLLVFFAACDDGEKTELGEDGTLGNPCYGNDTCNNGLTCEDGICVESTDVDDTGDADGLEDVTAEEDSESGDEDTEVGSRIIYVNASATGSGDGSSWENAFTDLQDALATSNSGDEIWVAAGTYYPTSGEDREISFEMVDGVSIYGGFAGTETERNERAWEKNETILSGDIGTKDDISDNTYQVVIGADGIIFDGFTVSDGNADGDGEENASCGGFKNKEGVESAISNCMFRKNAAGYGGVLCNYRNDINITNCTFIENSAEFTGGAIQNVMSRPVIKDCTFENNSLDKEDTGWSRGGAIYNLNSIVKIIDSDFFGNTVMIDGAGIYNEESTVEITGSTFKNNLVVDNGSPTYGGGMYNELSEVTINDCMFEANSAKFGGGIFSEKSTVIITGGSFIKNIAEEYDGGGVLSWHGSLKVEDSTFKENEAIYGAGISNSSGYLHVENCTFQNNISSDLGGAVSSWYSQDRIFDNIFKANESYLGGALAIIKGSANLYMNVFENNIAKKSGGGVYIADSSRAELIGCYFKENTAVQGGGLANEVSAANLLNNVFYKNSAVIEEGAPVYARGGAIFNGGDPATESFYRDNPFIMEVHNCTFVDNSAEDHEGDILNLNSSVRVLNSILRGGEGDSFNDTEDDNDKYFISITYSNYEGGFDGEGNIDEDPLFVDTENEDFHLQSGSPCIDKGDDTVVDIIWYTIPKKTDLDGNSRIVGDEIDMGAYEFQGE